MMPRIEFLKVKNFNKLLIVCAIAVLSSCKNLDISPNKNADTIAGTYIGTEIILEGQSIPLPFISGTQKIEANFVITKVDDNTVNLVFINIETNGNNREESPEEITNLKVEKKSKSEYAIINGETELVTISGNKLSFLFENDGVEASIIALKK